MSGHFDGKVALVTGGATGIGRSTALAFSREGAKVAIADINDNAGQETVNEIQSAGGEAIFVHTDVSQSRQVESLVDQVVQTWKSLDCAFNNAGILGDINSVDQTSEENWDRVMGVNLKGIWLCMKYEISEMLKLGGGTIVNTSSLFGLVGATEVPAYVASKHGVSGVTKAAALENAQRGIRINAVCPGTTRTPMLDRVVEENPDAEAEFIALEPTGRLANPEEIAAAVIWLNSDAASFVTGHMMSVDGARTAL